MAVKEFNPGDVSMIAGSDIASGFADGTFIKLSRNSQAFNLKVGADGEGTRVKSNDKSGKVEITLMQSSDFNDKLSAYAALDDSTGKGKFPLFFRDQSGRTVASAATAWIQKLPDTEFDKEAKTRTWVIETDELLLFVGGN